MNAEKPIVPSKFYGKSLFGIYDELDKKIELERKRRPADSYKKPRSLWEPRPHREEFWKQNEALIDAASNSEDDDILCCFVFQDEMERRRFIVTYPEDFWRDCETISDDKRVFYEVIPEYSPCFLYYDLEFETNLNEGKNGVKMTQTIIDITCEYIAKHWNYSCNRGMVINLDSSRSGKFSKHLIFSTRDVAFENNSHVGYLVKMICTDIINFVSCNSAEHDVLSKFNKADLQELFVETNKGKKLFIDTNVYTKNRHFRIYKATKWGKNSHLIYASDCEYVWDRKPRRKDMEIFLNSLISYLPRKRKMKLLSFDLSKKAQIQTYSEHAERRLTQSLFVKEYSKSPYPVLDKYISEYIKPGKIRVSKYLEERNLILFEIVGNRYCDNIGRWHKSNNIFFVVDLTNKIMYQKCHDEDCAVFVSTPIKLPVEVTFHFEDEADTLLCSIDDC